MKIGASILSIVSGLLQLVVCILLGAGRFVFNEPIEKLFYSGTLFFALSCMLIILGVSVLKFPRLSGAALVLLGTSCFFLGSVMFAPLAIIGGIMALAAPHDSGAARSPRARAVSIWLTALGFVMIVSGNLFAIYIWNKKAPKVENVSGIAITAAQLTKEYTADEKAADAKYLNKAIEVSGTVKEVEQNQDGGSMLILETGDPMADVQCAMRDKGVTAAKGQAVTIKGFCSGSGITGVSLTDCVIK